VLGLSGAKEFRDHDILNYEMPGPKAIESNQNCSLIARQQCVREAYHQEHRLETSSLWMRKRLAHLGGRPKRASRKAPFLSPALGILNLAESRSPLCEQMLPRSRCPRTAKGVSMIHETSLDRSGRRQQSDRGPPLQGYIPAAHTILFCGIPYGAAALARSLTTQVGFVYPWFVLTTLIITGPQAETQGCRRFL